jgi:hypothetical protein
MRSIKTAFRASRLANLDYPHHRPEIRRALKRRIRALKLQAAADAEALLMLARAEAEDEQRREEARLDRIAADLGLKIFRAA